MLNFFSVAEDAIRALGLVPFTYQGVPPRRGSIVNNVYVEAMKDLRNCRVLAVVVRQWDAEAEYNFGIAELPQELERGLVGLVYIVSERPDAAARVLVPPGVTVHVVRHAAEFAEAFSADLTALLRS